MTTRKKNQFFTLILFFSPLWAWIWTRDFIHFKKWVFNFAEHIIHIINLLLKRGRGHLFNRWDIYQVRHNQFLYLLSISVWLKNFAWKIQIWSHILPKNEFHNELYYFIKECTLTMVYRYELLPFVNNFVRYYCIPKWKKIQMLAQKYMI